MTKNCTHKCDACVREEIVKKEKEIKELRKLINPVGGSFGDGSRFYPMVPMVPYIIPRYGPVYYPERNPWKGPTC